jgi:integrase
MNYVLDFMTEVNPSQAYRLNTIGKLKQLAEAYNPLSFKELTRRNIVDYLDSFRKPEAIDPLHQWIGTYEFSRVILLRFFKWLYYPNHESKSRPKPDIMSNIPRVIRRETSIYKPTDLWTEEDDVLFYKYCPSVRDRCYHAVSRDTGCRPDELMKLKIKDVIVQQLENGYQIARIQVNGKTGNRQVRLNNSYPRLKDWLSNGQHPFQGNPNAALFCGIGRKNTGRKLARNTMFTIYDNYKKSRFPKLLDDPTVSPEDKRKIRELLRKPWNPYVRRHTAATEISKALKDSVLIDQYMGWSHSGNTRQKYQHYYNDDSFDAMLTMMDGLKPRGDHSGNKNLLKPRTCPNCNETNTPESRFCTKCKFVLTFDAYNETVANATQTRESVKEIKASLEDLRSQFYKLVGLNPKQEQINDALREYLEKHVSQQQQQQRKND